MSIKYELLENNEVDCLKDLCNDLMAFQKSKSKVTPERFDSMTFETRLMPSIKGARDNYFIIAKDGDDVVAYAYSNICNKNVYNSGAFGKFFEMDSVQGDYVGCLSQFYIKESYRGKGIGSKLFKESINWINSYEDIMDIFIFVSNGNDDALNFYKSKGFKSSHDILGGFITVMISD